MKKFFKMMMFIVVATMAFAACSQYEDENIVSKPTVKVNVTMTIDESRTSFGEPDGNSYPTEWSGDEKIKYSLNFDSAKDVTPVFADDMTSASAELELEDDKSGAYTIYAISPADACLSNNETYKNWNISIPTTQTPSEISCDPTAQILYAVSNTSDVLDASYSLAFKHVTAYGKMTLKNLALNGATISSISITSDADIAGRHYFYTEDAHTAVNSGAKSITITTDTAENIWFACAPVAFTELKVTVTTDKGIFTKTISASKSFKSGKIAVFSIDMSGVVAEKPAEYQLLTDVADLNVGDQVIIANTEAAQAISSTQNNNNRAQTAVTIENGCIVAPGDAVEIFEVEEGTENGSYAFKATKMEGYIYAASSGSNHMRTEANMSANSSWLITIADGVTSVVAQGANTRNTMQYNSGSGIFACYGSATQKPVDIYYLPSGNAPTTPSITASNIKDVPAAGVQGATTNVTLKNLTSGVTVTKDGVVVTAASLSGSTLTYTVSANSGDAREGWIKLAADGAECTITVSQLTSIIEYYVKVNKIVSGEKFLIVYNDQKAFTPLTSNYGYVSATAVTVNDGKILRTEATKALEFVLTSTGGGYHLQDGDGYYYYNAGTYKNYNRGTSAPTGSWMLTYNDDSTFKILFSDTNRWVQYDSDHSNFGCYDTASGTMPSIYQLNGTPISGGGNEGGEGGSEVAGATDVIDCPFTGVTSTSYTDWTGTGTSGAAYKGQSATKSKNQEYVQLKSTGSTSGIVTTKSAGNVSKVIVVWDASTTDGRTLDIYGKNTAYSAATDLYATDTQGTKLGSIVKGTSTELAIEGDYAFIGLRSKSGAMYLTQIQIVWGDGGEGGGETPVVTPLATPSVTATADGNTINVSWGAITGAKNYTVKCGTQSKDVTGTSTSFTGLAYSTKYNVTVVANPSDTSKNSASVAGTASATTEADPNAGGSGEDITLTFTSISNKVSSYTNNWEQTCNGKTWSITNFNNNNAGWTYIKCGSKNGASVASIATTFSIATAVKSVKVTVDAVTASYVNSTYLQVATDAAFSNVVETVNVTIKQGEVAYNITNPQANCYYKLVYDCAQAKSNGPVQISKVVYSAE